jgi:undecaprenyl-diphosphatase
VVQLGILVGASAAVGLVWAAVVRALPQADPGRATSRRIGTELGEHPGVRGFLRARLDPETATGLAMSLALAGVVATGIVFGVVVAMIRSRSGVVHADIAVTQWAAQNGTPFSWDVLGLITEGGSTPTVIIVALAASAYAIRRWKHRSVLLFFVAVVAGQFLLSNLVKIAVERVRPDMAPLQVLPGPSFPSGHATAAAATWAAVALVVSRGASPRVRATLAGAGAAIGVAVATTRVFLGAHWTSDAIGGLVLGWTWFGVCAVAFGGRVLRLGAAAKEAVAHASARTRSPGRSG